MELTSKTSTENQSKLLLSTTGLSVSLQPQFRVKNRNVGGKLIFENINLSIDTDAFVALVGESGSGKTLLTRALLDLLPPAQWKVKGEIRFNGETLFGNPQSQSGGYDNNNYNARYNKQTLQEFRKRTAVIFQEPTSYLSPAMRIKKQLIEALFKNNKSYKNNLKSHLISKLQAVQIINYLPDRESKATDYLNRYAHQFSQGQQQRLMLSMALGDFDLIIADEPTSSLDTTIQKEIIEMLQNMRKKNDIKAMFLITHDLRIVKALLTGKNDHVYFLEKDKRMGCYTIKGQKSHLFSHQLFQTDVSNLHDPIIKKLNKARKFDYTSIQNSGNSYSDKIHLKIENLNQSYNQGPFQKTTPIINISSLTVYKSQILGIVGESGCGKSTLIRSIARLLNHTNKNSKILYFNHADQEFDLVKIQPNGLSNDSREMQAIRNEMQIIFQDAATSFNPEMNLDEVMFETVQMVERRKNANQDDLIRELNELCIKLNLAKSDEELGMLYGCYPDELSAGQRQRFALARALIVHPKLLLADEPFTNVDHTTSRDLINVIKQFRKDYGTTVIVISHDLNVVLEICDYIAVMKVNEESGIGEIYQEGMPREIVDKPEPYVRELLDSILSV